MNRAVVYFVVAMAGASVLAIEILGTRILGPHYGVTLYLWSALIVVTLLSLSLGYFWGGRWADKNATLDRLALLLAGAGAWLLFIPLIKIPLVNLLQPLGLRAALLSGAFVLFAPALIWLGMVSPYALKLQAQEMARLGRTAGALSAVSTLASVAAALLTGFWLIPLVGVQRLTWSIGLLLLLTALVTFCSGRLKRWKFLIVLFLLLPLGALLPDAPAPKGIIHLQQSPYGEISIFDTPDSRYLLIDGAIHTASTLPDYKTQMRYAVVLDLVRFFFDETGDLLLIGLGGGSVAKIWSAEAWRVDAVEIDPVVVEMAQNYFGLAPEEAAIHILDGRQFLDQVDKQYPVIILDAFGSSSIPFHLTTREVFQLCKKKMTGNGVFAMNVECVGWDHALVKSLCLTLQSVFTETIVLPCSEPPNALGNVIILAADRPLSFPDEWLGNPLDVIMDDYAHWAVVQRTHAWDNRYVPDVSGAPLLSDDLNPADLWAEEINLEARKKLLEIF